MGENVKTFIKALVIKKIKNLIGLNVFFIIVLITVILAVAVDIMSKIPVIGDELVESFLGYEQEIKDSGFDIGIINLEKVSVYTEYEKLSIPTNLSGEIKSYSQTHDYRVDEFSIDITSMSPSIENKQLNISEVCYPYRLWWQSLAGLDIHLTSSNDIDDVNAIELMASELAPIFTYAYENANFTYNETSQQSTYTKTSTYEDGELVNENESQIDTLIITPLPYLEHVSTMFHEIGFTYTQVHSESQPWTTISNLTSSSSKYIEDDDGEYVNINNSYIKKSEYEGEDKDSLQTYKRISVQTVTRVDQKYDVFTYEINETKTPNLRFYEFVENNNFNGKLMDKTMTFIVDYGGFLPNSYDFVYNANTALNYSAFSVSGGGYEGAPEGDYIVVEDTEKEFIFPIQYAESVESKKFSISSNYGYRTITVNGVTSSSFHGAIDIPIPIGTPIMAAKGGTVIDSYYGSIGGNTIVIDHGDGYKTTYMHLSQRYFNTGDIVGQGTVLGVSGNTGRSTGPHLHFSIHENDVRIDPIPLLPVESM